MIRLTNVNKYFNRKKNNEIRAIDHTSIELADKGLVTFLGNSGCGKTTLLNAIGGLDKVDSGEIYIGEERLTGRSDGKKDEIRNANIGYIFQNYNLIEDDTVFNNVALVLRMMGIKDKREIEERVMYILKRVGIDRYKNRPAKMLSGGERQRVGIARAIVKNPKIIIADEPTGNLDSKNTLEIMNIIKAISREKLVILVTHEREIAEFYASRIVEIVDGKIVSDRENAHNSELDYRLENKIYLQDMQVQQELELENVKLKFYSDKKDQQLEIKVVLKNNNLYIETPAGIGEGSEAVELVDDHYRKISKDVYEAYEFDYANMLDQNFTPKYTSIFNPVTMIAGGYKKIFSYSLIKKILLVGFIMASMFAVYAVSSIAGITNITDDKFVQVNQNYLTVNGAKVTPQNFKKYENMDGIDYALPGNSQVNFAFPLDDYYQTKGAQVSLAGSLTALDMVEEEKLLEGRNAKDSSEIVIDRITADSFLSNDMPKMIGLLSKEQIIGRKVTLPRLGEFTIVGITDQGSPSIYADRELFMDILMVQAEMRTEEDSGYTEESEEAMPLVLSYGLRDRETVTLVEGAAPKKTGEVLIHEMHRYESAIGSKLDVKVNGKKLTVCGYYNDKRGTDALYVSKNTAIDYLMEDQTEIVLSPKDKEATYQKLSAQNVKVTDNYTADRESYIDSCKKKIIATILVSGIILLISLLEMYLMLRSSFLSRIKEVGVLRAIGLKKKDIYKMFVGEIIAMTTLTTIPGMAVMAYILNGISKIPMIGEQYLMNPLVLLISFGLVFGFNLVAGLLPVFNTMRKTPAAILSRNDVN
jgi:ABC-type lipoprotein export system ATPase subunit/ABC-type antimicrobial peptide transport system permease subunit